MTQDIELRVENILTEVYLNGAANDKPGCDESVDKAKTAILALGWGEEKDKWEKAAESQQGRIESYQEHEDELQAENQKLQAEAKLGNIPYKEAIALKAENQKLREALKVFANWSTKAEKLKDADSIVLPIRVEFLRRATKALEEK